MSTENISRETARWWEWRNQFEAIVGDQTADPEHVIDWTSARGFFRDGYAPRDAASKYLEAHHIGQNQ